MDQQNPQSLQFVMLKELFEAHLGPIREDVKALRQDNVINNAAIRTDNAVTREIAENAHKRIDRYENRFWGWICGIGGLGAAGGMTFGEGARHAIKALLS